MWQEILTGLIVGSLSFIAYELVWIGFFKTHPKIYIDIQNRIHTTRFKERDFDKVKCEYNFSLTFKNNSPYDAHNLSIIWPNDEKLFEIIIEKYNILKAYDQKTFETKFEIILDSTIVDSFDHNLNNYRPKQLKKIAFNVTYTNQYNRKFITKFFWNNCLGHNEIFNKTPLFFKKKAFNEEKE